MSRVAIPRGNAGQSFPIFDLTLASTRWSLLTPDEQYAAARTQAYRLVTFLCLARQTIRDCLIDLRLARTVDQWRELGAGVPGRPAVAKSSAATSARPNSPTNGSG